MSTTLYRGQFLKQMKGKSIDVHDAQQDVRLAGVELGYADKNGDGQIKGRTEMKRLFRKIDDFDVNGSYWSVRLKKNGLPTAVAPMVDAVRALADAGTGGPSLALADKALAAAFPGGAGLPVSVGATGPRATAIQYALGRLGFLHDLADGVFGPKTRSAVRSFQTAAGLPVNGVVNEATLSALDARAAAHDGRTAAAKAANPVAYLSNFDSFELSTVQISDTSQPVSWGHPQVRVAYGQFVKEYWEVLKTNRVECDCKTLALFFMDQFRTKMEQDTGHALPLPSSPSGSIPNRAWVAATADKPHGFFGRFEDLDEVRPGYGAAQGVQALDPDHSMLFGVNVRYPMVSAPQVARAATVKLPWSTALDNHGDKSRPEVPIQQLDPGDMIFIDHTGDGTYDHTVNVVDVRRDGSGKVRSLRLAVGSFDDMKDADGATAPSGLGEVNNYAEELEVRFSTSGKIIGSRVTWASEPSYLVRGRYSARSTLMEHKPGGKLLVSRWG